MEVKKKRMPLIMRYENHAGVGRSKQPRGGLSWALILVLLILTSPVWAGLGLGLLGVLLGLAGACLGVLVALVLSGVGLVVGGVVLFLNALFYPNGNACNSRCYHWRLYDNDSSGSAFGMALFPAYFKGISSLLPGHC